MAADFALWVEQDPVVREKPRGWRWRAKRRVRSLRRLARNVAQTVRLCEELRRWGVDIVHTNSSCTPFGALLAAALKIPHVWHLREFNDLDYACSYDFGRNLTRWCIRCSSAQIAISSAIAEYYRVSHLLGQPHVIYNGIASRSEFAMLRESAYRTENVIRGTGYIFGIVGIIEPNKGQEEAIRALALVVAAFPKTKLVVVGRGDTRLLRTLAFDLNIGGSVSFWGHVEDPYRAFSAIDALLMCSKFEGMGRVTVEAMSAGRPVIGYDNAGTAEIIENGHTGLLYRGNHSALSDCMMRFVAHPGWARGLGLQAAQTVQSRFNLERYAAEVYGVYVKLLAERCRL